MSYPQGNFYPQSNIYPQGNFYPSGSFGHPQGSVGYHPQGIFGQGTFGQGIFGGYPQQPFGLAQGPFAQGPTQQTFGFTQGQMQQPFGFPQGPTQQAFGFPQGPTQFGQAPTQFGQLPAQLSIPTQLTNWGAAGANGVANGALSTASLSQQPQHQLLLQLAQYHYFVAQQLTQLATQQAILNPAGPYAGQFLPGQMAANFVPGITMH
jgi:hypothetical protein